MQRISASSTDIVYEKANSVKQAAKIASVPLLEKKYVFVNCSRNYFIHGFNTSSI